MDKLEEFTKYFLSNKNIWFNPQNKYDKFIKYNYGKLFENIPDDIFSNSDCNIFNIMLIYDQLSYYLYRDDFEKIRKNQTISKNIARYFIDTNKIHHFDDIYKVFILLSLRHGNDIDDIDKVIEIVRKLREKSNSNILKRFYNASLLKQSQINNIKYIEKRVNSSNEINNDIIDENSNYIDLMSITKFYNCDIFLKIKENVKDYNNICVSLSGGVDSMVLLFLLSHIENKNIQAIHINYKNRDTSDDEMNMCISFCNYLNIPIFVREITEIKRSRDKDRDLYEEVTRKIRFSFYKLIQDEFNSVISMGHNKDDCIENIFSNIIRQQKYDNLNGMEFSGNELDVDIIRPFLDISKEEIYNIANYYKLPHLYDSTPKWSDRGKKRDILVPFLNNFDERIIPGIIEINNRLNMLYRMNQNTIENIVRFINKDNIICNIDKTIIDYDIEFYIDLFGFICKKQKMKYFSKKSIINLREKILEKRYSNITLTSNFSFHNFQIIKI